MVAAERQHIVSDSHVGAGTVAGAAHEAPKPGYCQSLGL